MEIIILIALIIAVPSLACLSLVALVTYGALITESAKKIASKIDPVFIIFMAPGFIFVVANIATALLN